MIMPVKTTDPLDKKHDIRDTIHIALELAEYTKLPFLFLGNPGIAKTTNIRSWADRKNYKVVSLIGSQRTAEEILGYMVNTGKKLETFVPDWFDEIMEYHADGHKTVLFIDELSTAPENVQGAMLQLIFDRKVGGRNYLPDDTIVISAANYKENLPPQNRIMAPTLNRFVIVNLEATDGKDFAQEFLQPEDRRNDDLIEFDNIEITDSIKEVCRQNMVTMMDNLFTTYAVDDGQKPRLDISHQAFDEVYDQPGKVYNFITGRSIHYLYQLCLGILHLGIGRKRYGAKIANMLLGLIGNGTNSFKREEDRADYQQGIILIFQRVIKQTQDQSSLTENKVKLDFNSMSVTDSIQQWLLYNNGNEVMFDDNFKNLIDRVEKDYKADVVGMGKKLGALQTEKDMVEFVDALQKIDHLAAVLENTNIREIQPGRNTIKSIQGAWAGYKQMIMTEVIGA
jgi:hypothetical protein